MPAYRDKDCPECGRLAPMTALRCTCGHKFPQPLASSERHEVESRIYDRAELVLVLSDLDNAAQPIRTQAPREITATRSPFAVLHSAQTDEGIQTVENVVQGAWPTKLVVYALIVLFVIAGIIYALRLTLAVAHVRSLPIIHSGENSCEALRVPVASRVSGIGAHCDVRMRRRRAGQRLRSSGA